MTEMYLLLAVSIRGGDKKNVFVLPYAKVEAINFEDKLQTIYCVEMPFGITY